MICGDTTNLDYLSAAVHEYGHALGLGHSTTPDATMYSVMFAQDTTARALLGCETDMVIKAYHDDNAAAIVTGFAVTRGDGITATWLAEQEAATDHYVLEHAPVWPGPFMPLAHVPLDGAGEYAVMVPAVASGVFRLTEVEADGDTLPLWTEPDIEPSGPAPQFVQQTINFDSTLAALLSELSWLESAATEPTQYYIYCPGSLAGSFQVLADVHTRWEGVPTEVVTYESIGGPIGVKAHIASHLPDGGFILKVGDAWEGVDVFGMAWRNNPVYYQDNGFTVDPWLPQPHLNLSPLTYRQEMAPQPISLSHWTPFVATPWWVVDHDDDGLPDPGYYLGYAPVSDQSEAEIFVAKSIQQMCSTPNPPSNKMPPAVVMTYARDYGNNSGALVKQMSESLRAYVREVNPNLALYGTTTTDDNPLSTIQRNAAMKARFDAGMSSCTFLSTVSQRYELGAYAHVDIDLLGYYFDVNALAPNQILAFGILITCEAGFARTESEYGTPVAERLLFVPNRGFWGYFGPERGSLQRGNDRIGRIIHRRQYETLPGAMPPTVGELANETVREAAAFKPDSLLACRATA